MAIPDHWIGSDLETIMKSDGVNRLGFAVKVLGRTDLKSHDARRWQIEPHLRVSLGYLDAIFEYLRQSEIRMYRISSDIAPYATHPDMPQFHHQLEACLPELERLGAKARHYDLRLSMHPAQYIVLNSPDKRIVQASIRDFVFHADFLGALGCGPEAKIVTHVGGVYGDRTAAMDRFVTRYEALPDNVRKRLVLENDETSYTVPDVLSIHERTGVPVVFDILHHRVLNPAWIDPADAARRCLATWPEAQTPKMHYSTQRIAEREIGRPGKDGKVKTAPAKPGQHDDWIDGDDFTTFMGEMSGHSFDVMLEAKQKDLALLRRRDSIRAAGLDDVIW